MQSNKLTSLAVASVILGCSILAGWCEQPTLAIVRFVLVGDSTVNGGSGWGPGFQKLLTAHARCTNLAANGRSSKSYRDEGRWTNALALRGDYYLIQFGHNNEPGKPGRSTDMPTYINDMVSYVEEARAIGAKPILVTPLTRRQWDKANPAKIKSTLVVYAEALKKIGAEHGVDVLDIHQRSIELCEKLGREKCYEFSPIKVVDGTNSYDGTHLNAKGSDLFGRIVAEELVRAVPELSPCFNLGERLSSSASSPERSEVPIPNRDSSSSSLNVRDFGATGDGKTLDTEAIQKALDQCGKAGGGTVLLPAGNYLSKPIFLRSKTTLQLPEGAVLQGTDGFDDYKDRETGRVLGLVNAQGLTDVAISGKGTIDGAGARWWEPVKSAKHAGKPEPRRRPRMVIFSNCKGVRVQGVTLANSPSFHLVPTDCEDVLIEGVTIRAPGDSPNTDAIDPSACKNVRIIKCVLDVGDDNVALKSGHSVPGRTAACEDIFVADCTMLHGHGMSIGSETIGGVRHLAVRHCTFQDTISGLRIKSTRGKGGVVEDISYSDITMYHVKTPINITCYYPKVPESDTAKPMTDSTPVYHNIHISNLIATNSPSGGLIVGLPESLVSDVVLENVRMSAHEGLTIRNAKGIVLKNVNITPDKGPPLITENAEVEEAK